MLIATIKHANGIAKGGRTVLQRRLFAAVLNLKSRPIDYAVVWVYQGNITWFLAGSGT